jgi:hypothetical protein
MQLIIKNILIPFHFHIYRQKGINNSKFTVRINLITYLSTINNYYERNANRIKN